MTMSLHVRGLTKEYEGTHVLTGVTFHLAQGEKVGLVGLNGCGKSTLMRILAGESEADGGSVHWVHPERSVAYLSQEDIWAPHRPLGEQLGPVDDDLLSRCGIDRALLSRPAGTLSGGQKTRAGLARVLAGKPDLLLLDEPTTHVDTDGLDWLESVLRNYPGTVLLVSHDRWFLDRVVTRILEMNGGKVKEYPGNYSAYARQKQAEREKLDADYHAYLKQKRHLEEAIRREREWAMRAHRTKVDKTDHRYQKGHNENKSLAHMRIAASMEKKLERIRVEKPREQSRIHLGLESGTHVARNLILAEDLGFTYDGSRWLFRKASFYVQRGDRVALVGPNGAGKTTLIRLLLGDLSPTEGALRRSPLRVAYLAQEMENLTPSLTVLEEASGGNAALDQARVRTLLACLLFAGEAIFKKVAVLSGGEKVRLALAKILLSDPDMLMLDEPTNGLDLTSRERVEEALLDYPGTLLLVSHDRYLLERLASRVIQVKEGRLDAFHATYAEFVQRNAAPGPTAAQPVAEERMLLENRLAQLSALLDKPAEGEAERLTQEFIAVSRALRALRERRA
ncbi:MAG: ribosomal protection-like ABC-F family protein [Bacillota bacterium]